MPQIFLDHLIAYPASAPCPVADRPEMAAPIFLAYRRKPLLEKTQGTPLQLFRQYAYAQRRRILDVHVDMVLAHNPFGMRTFPESNIRESRSRQRYVRSPGRTEYLYLVAQTI